MKDINTAKTTLGFVPQMFLHDGDAIAISTTDQLRVLHKLRLDFPELQEVAALTPRVGCQMSSISCETHTPVLGAKMYQGIKRGLPSAQRCRIPGGDQGANTTHSAR